MTRFIMTLSEAVRLVMESVFLPRGGEVFVTKMPVVRIEDLAAVMISELAPIHGYAPEDIELQVIGSKPGEKLYEESLTMKRPDAVSSCVVIFAVVPAFRSIYEDIDYRYPDVADRNVEQAYNSSLVQALSSSELIAYLRENKLLEGDWR